MKRRKIIVLGSYGHGNVGDDAIILSMLMAFEKVMPKNVEITVFSKNDKYLVEKRGINFINPWRLRNLLKILKEYKKNDLMILGGGGLIQDKSSLLNMLFWCGNVLISKSLKNTVMCYAIGVGPVESSFGKILARLALNKVDLITVRDDYSKRLLRDLRVNRTPIYTTADPAILLPSGKLKIEDAFKSEGIELKEKTMIALSLRYWFHTKPLLPAKFVLEKKLWLKKEREKFTVFLENMAKLADRLVEELDSNVVFISMQKYDYKVSMEVKNLMKNRESAIVLKQTFTANETKAILGQMDLTISVYLHPLILSASMGTPVFGFAYAPKVPGFMEMIGQSYYIGNIDNIELGVLLKKIKLLWNERRETKIMLRSRINELGKKSFHNAELAFKLLVNPPN